MSLANWTPPPAPERKIMAGRYVRLEPLEDHHLPDLWAAQTDPEIWRYIPAGPFDDENAFGAWLSEARQKPDPLQFAVRMEDGQIGGTLSLLRIKPEAGSIEVGYIVFTPRLQNTRDATEAIYLTMKFAFEAGYRRFEWKCDSANLPSRRAAQRLGLSYEGIFRQATVVKGRNRDSAWFAAIDKEWPSLETAFETWLAPENFNEKGDQKSRLSDLTKDILVARDPGT